MLLVLENSFRLKKNAVLTRMSTMCTEPSSSVSQSLPDEQQTEASEEASSKEQVTKIESLRN
jgi:hypothetical protein